MSAKKNEVAVKEDKLPIEADFLDELTADADEYAESMSQDDMSIPFLLMLQALSPACTEGKPEYNEKAKPGRLYNTVDAQVFDVKNRPLTVIPVYYKPCFLEWVPRSSGDGGFAGEHTVEEGLRAITMRNDKGEDIIQPDSPVGTPGNQLSATHTHFLYVIDEDTGLGEPVVASLASTQIKHSKKFNALVNKTKVPGTQKTAPRFFGVYEVTSILETKGSDKTWHSWVFSPKRILDEARTKDEGRDIYNRVYITDLPNGRELYAEIKAFVKGLEAGEHKVDYDKAATQSADNPNVGDAPSVDDVDDEEIPF